MSVLIVYQIIHNLHIVVVSVCGVFFTEAILHHRSQFVVPAEDPRAGVNPKAVRVHANGFITKSALFC